MTRCQAAIDCPRSGKRAIEPDSAPACLSPAGNRRKSYVSLAAKVEIPGGQSVRLLPYGDRVYVKPFQHHLPRLACKAGPSPGTCRASRRSRNRGGNCFDGGEPGDRSGCLSGRPSKGVCHNPGGGPGAGTVSGQVRRAAASIEKSRNLCSRSMTPAVFGQPRAGITATLCTEYIPKQGTVSEHRGQQTHRAVVLRRRQSRGYAGVPGSPR